MITSVPRVITVAVFILTIASSRLEGASCTSLKGLALPDTTITLAEPVDGGKFVPPETETVKRLTPGSIMGGGEFPSYDRLPAFCRVAATIRPVPDSTIKIEVWLPTENWNGKFMGVGNGGWSGEVWHPALAKALARGYAAASTDTGHEGPGLDASFAIGHPEKVIDSGWRAVHEMTVTAKAIVAAFYMRDPAFSYWDGCSTGGRQGLA